MSLANVHTSDGSLGPALRVLVLAYYFPPMGMSGVQRVAKFVKYLPQYGWQPTVLTVEPAGYFAFDPSLLEEVEAAGIEIHRTPSTDPTRLFKKKEVIAMPGEFKRKTFSYFSQMFFIPDNKKGWMEPALEVGTRLIKEGKFDAIFSSAPPYTSHLIGMELSRRSGLPLISDFRDDWVGNPRHRYPTPWHRRQHERLEKKVLDWSAAVTTINRVIQDNLVRRNLGAGGYNKMYVIPQGYDASDFADRKAPPPGDRLRLLYTGVFYDAQQPNAFLKALADLIDRRPELRKHILAEFLGLFPDQAKKLIDKLGLQEQVMLGGYVPHDEVIAHMMAADVLWMTIGRQKGEEMISTGKLYEYIGTHKPILGLVPNGAAQRTLERYGATEIASPDDIPAISRALESLYERWTMKQLPQPDHAYVMTFDRRLLAGDLAEVFRATLSRLDEVYLAE